MQIFHIKSQANDLFFWEILGGAFSAGEHVLTPIGWGATNPRPQERHDRGFRISC